MWSVRAALRRVPATKAVIRGAGTRPRYVALTFDDGPSKYTPQVRKILRRAGVKATFFVLGRAARANRAEVRRLVKEGHVIADHTWSHRALTTISAAAVDTELKDTLLEIKRTTGASPTLMRPPYGTTSASVNRIARRYKMLVVVWNVDSADWQNHDPDIIFNRVMKSRNLGPGSIVLMHDGGGNRAGTVAALPRILKALKEKGLTAVTLPVLLKALPPDPNSRRSVQ